MTCSLLNRSEPSFILTIGCMQDTGHFDGHMACCKCKLV